MHISCFHSDSSSGSFGSNSMNSSKKSVSSLKHAPTHVCGEYLGMDESGLELVLEPVHVFWLIEA